MRQNEQSRGLSRRRFLAAGGAAATAAVAGCAGVVNWVVDQFFGQVNVGNNTGRTLDGSITVVGPDDETLLDESFSIAPGEENGEDNTATYDSVWTETGSYEVTVQFDDPVEEVSTATETVTVEDTGDDVLLVVVGADEVEETVLFSLGDSFTDAVPDEVEEG